MKQRDNHMKRVRDLLQKAAIGGLSGVALFAAVRHIPGYDSVRLGAYDYLVNVAPILETDEEVRVVTIGISEKDIKKYGWPIRDELLCKVIGRLADEGARAIGLDLYRDTANERGCLSIQSRSIRELVTIFSVAEGIEAIPGSPTSSKAYNDIVVDSDRVVRRDLVHVTGKTEEYTTFPMRLLEKWGKKNIRKNIESIGGMWLAGKETPYAQEELGGLQVMMPYQLLNKGKEITLDEALNAKTDLNARDAIAIIGSRAKSLKDYFETPKSKQIIEDSYTEMAGVDLHRLRIRNLLWIEKERRPALGPISKSTYLSVLLIFAILSAALGSTKKGVATPVLAGVALVGLIALVSWCGVIGRYWIDPVDCLTLVGCITTAGVLRNGLEAQKEKELMRMIFGQSVSRSVAEKMWNDKELMIEKGMISGRTEYVSVLFMDTVGFSTLSERAEAKELIEWLNKGLDICISEIVREGGIINKFTGDGLVAIFGSPVKRSNNIEAESAVSAAVRIQQRITRLMEEGVSGIGDMRLRIGIHSGEAMCGSVGNRERLEYTVIGDAVNCAARLESLDKERNDQIVRILMSEQTHELLSYKPESLNVWGEMSVKGRECAVSVYEIRGPTYQCS